VAQAAVQRYLQVRGLVPDSRFREDLETAVFGWRLMTPAWFARGALDDDDLGRQDRRRPSRRAFVLHRLSAAADSDGSPGLVALARDVHDALRGRWGDVPLDLAPAFAGQS
jgi:hypothetical protein